MLFRSHNFKMKGNANIIIDAQFNAECKNINKNEAMEGVS